MDTKEIKIGEKYKLELLCIYNAGKVITFETPTGDHLPFRERDLECVSPAAPKYDPCRPFKKGDIVEPVACNGRAPLCLRKYIGTKQVVECDEDNNGVVGIVGDVEAVFAAFLKLITPIEELEPYYVSTNIDCSTCTIFKRVGEKKFVHSAYYFVHGKGCSNAILGIIEAQDAAETECKRLNAEYRKEVEK